MNDPWAFGWTQVLTLIGLAITVCIAVGGFRTFGRWRNEKLEENRIAVALEAAAIAFEAKYVFDNIRSPMSFGYEWEELPKDRFKGEAEWSAKGAYFAVGKRVRDNKEFFERVFKLQPKCMAAFGKGCEDIFMLLHRARREIEVASQMLTWRDNFSPDMHAKLEQDIWDSSGVEPEKDRVGKKLIEFREKMEALCEPVIGGAYRKPPGKLRHWWSRL
jgi:hypothetical protein